MVKDEDEDGLRLGLEEEGALPLPLADIVGLRCGVFGFMEIGRYGGWLGGVGGVGAWWDC